MNLKKIDNITFTGPAVDDSLLDHIAQFPKLRNLNAGRVQGATIEGGISDDGLKKIVKCQDLFSLYLDYTRVTDAGLAPLLEMPKLSSVQFSQSPGVTKAGIAKLKEAMPSLMQPAIREPAKHGHASRRATSGEIQWVDH